MPTPSALDVSQPRDRQEPDLPARYRARVLAAFPGQIERIVVFGSRARGEPDAESDWDFAGFFKCKLGERQRDRLWDIDWELGQSFGCQIQSLELAAEEWLAQRELACNIRDHGLIIYGPNDAPRIERPVMQHARDALAKAERFADLSARTADDRFEGVIHGAYYAMFHSARAALLAVGRSSLSKDRPAPNTVAPSTSSSAWSSAASAPRPPDMPLRSCGPTGTGSRPTTAMRI